MAVQTVLKEHIQEFISLDSLCITKFELLMVDFLWEVGLLQMFPASMPLTIYLIQPYRWRFFLFICFCYCWFTTCQIIRLPLQLIIHHYSCTLNVLKFLVSLTFNYLNLQFLLTYGIKLPKSGTPVILPSVSITRGILSFYDFMSSLDDLNYILALNEMLYMSICRQQLSRKSSTLICVSWVSLVHRQ